MIHLIVDGAFYSLGIVGGKLIELRDYSRQEVAWVPTIFVSSYKVFSFVGSGLHRLYGCRVPVILGALVFCAAFLGAGMCRQSIMSVYLCLGVMGGLGYTLLYGPTLICANTYYREKRELANGLVLSGSSIGAALFAPLTHWTLSEYGLQGTCLVLAGIALQTLIFGLLIPPLNLDDESECLLLAGPTVQSVDEDGQERGRCRSCQKAIDKFLDDFIAVDLLKNWKYAASVVATGFVVPVNMHTMYTYLPDYIAHVGYKDNLVWQPIAIIGITNAVARLTMGLKNKSVLVITIAFACAELLISGAFFSMPCVLHHYWLICVMAGVFGYGKGIFWSLFGPVLAEIVGILDFDRAYGTAETALGFVVLLCPLFGALFDMTAEYTWTFLASGIVTAAGGSILLTLITKRSSLM